MRSSRRVFWLIIAAPLVAVAGLMLAVTAYDHRAGSYTFATHQENTRHPQTGADIAEALEKQNGWKVRVLSGPRYNFIHNVSLVEAGEVDFAMSASDVLVESVSVRTVLPIYPEVLIVLYAESLGDPRTLEDLLRGRKVGVGPEELPLSQHMLNIIREFGIDQSMFTPVYHPLDEVNLGTDQMDVLFTFVGTNSIDLEKLVAAGNRFFSFDDPSLEGRGSRVDGYLMRHPYMRSIILPKNSFGKYPSEPVLTLGIPMTIIARSDMSDDVIYSFVAAVFENSTSLFRKNSILGFLSQDFDVNKLNFPIHEGTLQYLNRDQPTFLERYAEVMALFLSVSILLSGVLAAVRRLVKQRKKDRIDVYYEKVRGFGGRSPGSREEVEEALAELAELKLKALRQLQEESLAADESFSIFVELLHYEVARLERLRDALGGPSSGVVS